MDLSILRDVSPGHAALDGMRPSQAPNLSLIHGAFEELAEIQLLPRGARQKQSQEGLTSILKL